MAKKILTVLYGIIIAAIACGYSAFGKNSALILPAAVVYVLISVFAGSVFLKTRKMRLRVCAHGVTVLSSFLLSASLSVVYHVYLAFKLFSANFWQEWVFSALLCIAVLYVYFLNGILSLYCCSVQMGIKQRVIGALFGMVPIVNLIILRKIIKTVIKEIEFETEKEKINLSRKEDKLCQTKYPILLVHGVFFRDIKYLNYWGRIPKELENNGASVFYGNHASASSVADSAEELSARIKAVLSETGAEKVNIIAHSKGGLDCRYAIAKLGMEPFVASLTTINTPHRGCIFADELLEKIPADIKEKVANAYNTTLNKLGESNADFLAAVTDLTASACRERDEAMPKPRGVFCQSVGSVMPFARGGKFPLNLSFHLVRYYDGENDGLVSERSFSFGDNYILLKPEGSRGISHGDMIDLNRENIEGFDVREFYVKLVNDLKNKGL